MRTDPARSGMSYEQALACLRNASVAGTRLGLSRMWELMHLLGDPQDAVPVIHIAGTNGKGSVGAMTAAVLTAAGSRVGHFSSPALTEVTDCYRINGSELSGSRFAAILSRVADCAEGMKDPPTEYELLAAAAFALFAEERCDVSIIECCMGGDTDCTNVAAAPILSVITNVQADHCAYLGDTPAKIAAHKAGIIKPGCPVLTDVAASSEEAVAVIRERANSLDAPLYDTGALAQVHLLSASPEGMEVSCTVSGSEMPVRLGLAGRYQTENLRTVLGAVHILRQQGMAIPPEAVRQGLAACRWKGRFELLRRDPPVIFDGAHNVAGMQQAAESLKQYFGEQRAVLLIGVMADKDRHAFAKILKPRICRAFTVRPENARALAAEVLADCFRQEDIPVQSCATVREGVCTALSCAKAQHVPLAVFGSLYLYREFRKVLDTLPE